MRFMMSVVDVGTETASAAEVAAIDGFNARLQADGAWVLAGGLASPGSARVVDATGPGEALVTQGPFAETTEHVAGFWVVDAPDEEAALALAVGGSRACGRKVELRAFL